MRIFSCLSFEVKEISAKSVRRLWRFAYACAGLLLYGTGSAERPEHRSKSLLIKAQVAPRSPYRTGDLATFPYTQSQSAQVIWQSLAIEVLLAD